MAGLNQKVMPLEIGQVLLDLAFDTSSRNQDPIVSYWGQLAKIFLTRVRESLEPDKLLVDDFKELQISTTEIETILTNLPAMHGLEYCSAATITTVWESVKNSFARQVRESAATIDEFLRSKNDLWATVGRVFFHLAENKQDSKRPFAFMATYTTKISQQGRLQHAPLGRAVEHFSREAAKSSLLAILIPVHKAAANSPFLKRLVDERLIYHPQPWGAAEAFEFLKDIPIFEEFGIGIRIPNWWSAKKPRQPSLKITVGEETSNVCGADALLDFSAECVIDGQQLTQAEIQELLAAGTGLVQFKGSWTYVDSERLQEIVAHLKKLKARKDITLLEGLRLLAGTSLGGDRTLTEITTAEARHREVVSGAWLTKTLEALRNPATLPATTLATSLTATLRPYQERGVQWLWYLYSLGLGGCLADDMGLGKTLQIIALLLLVKSKGDLQQPALLIVPASLIGNWKAECGRFAPNLRIFVAHASENSAESTVQHAKDKFGDYDLVITTYTALLKSAWATDLPWSLIVIDEAQAIKNSDTKQTKAIKSLKGKVRFALTGTPIENRLSDLWSLYDFIQPGLLGTPQEFSKYIKNQINKGPSLYANLRNLIRPYLLRRLKVDKSIIADLPDKTETKVFCTLAPRQVALYQQGVLDLAKALNEVKDDIQRKGLVLSYLMRFKQLCNHPAQWLGHGEYTPKESGKLQRLQAICEEIAERQEKVLIFSQFSQILDPLSEFLRTIFGKPGFILSGDTAIKQRQTLVSTFQEQDGAAFFLLSLKAGGTGLNLTAASHIVHFDRWWNPAVENQATDRAFRIGQKRNVLVHKFICKGTVEEKIDHLISSKQGLSDNILSSGGSEKLITEMSDAELMRFVALDLNKVSE